MENIKISLDASGATGEVSVVRVDGVIDTMTASELEKIMNSLLDQKRYNIVIDLGGVDYISSAGWGIFISNIREIRHHDGDIKLVRMMPNVHEIFELLEFDSILKCFDNVEKARQDFGADGGEARPESTESGTDVSPLDTGSYSAQEETVASVITPVMQDEPAKIETPVRTPSGDLDAEARVLRLVREDPFRSISEMKKILNSQNGFDEKIGWWKIRSILGKNGLRSKKKRFRYAQGR